MHAHHARGGHPDVQVPQRCHLWPGRQHVACQARPRAAAINVSRTGASKRSAPASKTAVSLWVVRLIPRSRSLTVRGLKLDASASSSCVRLASARSCRSSPAKLNPGSATGSASPPNLSAAATPHLAERPAQTVCCPSHVGHSPPPMSAVERNPADPAGPSPEACHRDVARPPGFTLRSAAAPTRPSTRISVGGSVGDSVW